jgi:18S rRNA (guanine1575-N7)-methyltransferase
MIGIQRHLAERALELLNLPPGEPSFIADLGCGSGLSGEVLSQAGHHWLGFDVSAAMLDVATQEETDGDLCLLDLGQGLPVRNAVFDGAIRCVGVGVGVVLCVVMFLFSYSNWAGLSI